jgi:ABC-2 type transport system ATP-binding protein
MEEPKALVVLESATRDFGRVRAVDALDLAVRKGELFGLVGPDGAGKTTTLRLLAGLLDLTSGTGAVAGYDLFHEAESIKRQIGYMAQQFSLYAELTVSENLRFFADLYDVPVSIRDQRMGELLLFAGLDTFRDRRAAHLSGGMQKKLALACTLIHKPPILLLDEPTTGVDPVSRREFWRILGDLHLEGSTIIVSTPYMDEADRCSRVGLMYEGRLMVCESPLEIRGQIEAEMVVVISDEWQKAGLLAAELPGVYEVQTYGESLHILVDSADRRLPEIQNAFNQEQIGYRQARVAAPGMEEAFISLIRRMEAAEEINLQGHLPSPAQEI